MASVRNGVPFGTRERDESMTGRDDYQPVTFLTCTLHPRSHFCKRQHSHQYFSYVLYIHYSCSTLFQYYVIYLVVYLFIMHMNTLVFVCIESKLVFTFHTVNFWYKKFTMTVHKQFRNYIFETILSLKPYYVIYGFCMRNREQFI